MVKFLGVLLLIVGSVGFSATLCRELRRQRMQLLEMKRMFLMIQEDIRYSGLPLPLIIQKTADKMNAPFDRALVQISSMLIQNNGEQLYEVWEKEMSVAVKGLSLSGKQQTLLLEFPQSLGLWEREGQAKALTFYIDETDKWIVQLEKEEKDKNKVIMSLGAAAGILLSVLLL